MVGCSESEWFEAKREAYHLAEVVGQFELAKDVSAFANCGGGILVVGLKTTNRDGTDVVVALAPVKAELAQSQAYRSALRARLYPRIHGLEFATTEVTGGQVVMGIRVPRQPSASLPILVTGMPGAKARRPEGGYWAVFRRQRRPQHAYYF
jgi:predicted HTH transcriptional regulator